MCFELDARPPIVPIAGGALDAAEITLTARDGNRFSAYRARAATPTGAGMIVLPDVRGLHVYYEELALRFAEAGIDAIAIDYFGRTAGLGRRDGGFEFMPHVDRTTLAGLRADIDSASGYLRSSAGGAVRSLFTIGFCFGGRLAFVSATFGLELAGVIGFYGPPGGAGRNDVPAPTDVVGHMTGAVLGIFGGADQGIPADAVTAFGRTLEETGVRNELVTYPGAPHSFFDRLQEQHADASTDAWQRVLSFVAAHRT